MLNSLETYRVAGQKSGLAAKRRDQGAVTHWNSWYRRAINLEKTADRAQAERTYTNAYKEAFFVSH